MLRRGAAWRAPPRRKSRWKSPAEKCVLSRRRCCLKSWEFRRRETALPFRTRRAGAPGRRAGGENSIHARQTQGFVRPLRAEQAIGRFEKTGDFQWPLLRRRRQGRALAHVAAVSQYTEVDARRNRAIARRTGGDAPRRQTGADGAHD